MPCPHPPSLVLHTGDLSHLSKPAEFDTVSQVMKSIKTQQSFFVPGEHDYFVDNGKRYLERFGKGTKGTGWQSFDYKGVHFVGLVNVANISNGQTALGVLGNDQLEWMEKDVAGLGASTPIVVFAHVPLWTVYEKWGWGTQDSAQALALLRRFGSVSVLNGHIHQILQKVEGNITFPHRPLDGLPAAGARHGRITWPDEKYRRGKAAELSRNHPGGLCGAHRDAGDDGFDPCGGCRRNQSVTCPLKLTVSRHPNQNARSRFVRRCSTVHVRPTSNALACDIHR